MRKTFYTTRRHRDVHIVMLARYDDAYQAGLELMAQGRASVRQGSGRPSTGSSGATMSIFLGPGVIARLESCVECWEVIHSFRALTGRGHNVLRERPRD